MKNTVIKIRVTEVERRSLERAAEGAGRNLSEEIRSRLFREPIDPEVIKVVKVVRPERKKPGPKPKPRVEPEPGVGAASAFQRPQTPPNWGTMSISDRQRWLREHRS